MSNSSLSIPKYLSQDWSNSFFIRLIVSFKTLTSLIFFWNLIIDFTVFANFCFTFPWSSLNRPFSYTNWCSASFVSFSRFSSDYFSLSNSSDCLECLSMMLFGSLGCCGIDGSIFEKIFKMFSFYKDYLLKISNKFL